MLNKELKKININIKQSKKENNKLKNALKIKNEEQEKKEKKDISNSTWPVGGSHLLAGEKVCHLCGSNSSNIVEDNKDENFAFKMEKRSKLMKIIIFIIIITLLSLYIFFPAFRYTITEKRVVKANETIVEERD